MNAHLDLFRPASFTTVVNVKDGAYDVYCGRQVRSKNLPDSIWRNRHILEEEADRAKVIAAYETDLDDNPTLLVRLVELRGKRLACWCHPKACHCDVLARRADSPSKEILVAHFRARRSFGRNTSPRPQPADWLAFLQRHGLVPPGVPSWALLTEEDATKALVALAAIHRELPPLDTRPRRA